MSSYGRQIAGAIRVRRNSVHHSMEWGLKVDEAFEALLSASYFQSYEGLFDRLIVLDVHFALQVMQLHWGNIPDDLMIIATGKTRKQWLAMPITD